MISLPHVYLKLSTVRTAKEKELEWAADIGYQGDHLAHGKHNLGTICQAAVSVIGTLQTTDTPRTPEHFCPVHIPLSSPSPRMLPDPWLCSL